MITKNETSVENSSHRSVLSVGIICVAVICAVWVWQHQTNKFQTVLGASAVQVQNDVRPQIDTNTDWQAMLQGTWNQGSTTILTSNSAGKDISSGEGTLTDQMAKDFFGQYLQLSQGGQEVTADQANQIALNTLASPQYTKATGVQYSVSDLHVGKTTNAALVAEYGDAVQKIVTRDAPASQTDAMTVLNQAVKSNQESDLIPLDQIITSEKVTISDLLAMTIPSDAISTHLGILNAISNLLDNTEAMRQSFTDPVRSFAALSQYPVHITDVQNAFQNLATYSTQK